jgi:hypothetical protein
MPRRRSILDKMRSPARAEPAAWLVIIGLLIQAILGVPAAQRMAAQALAEDALDPVHALCLAAATDSDGSAGQPASPSRPASHDHVDCALCNGGLGAMLAAGSTLTATLSVDSAPEPALPTGPVAEADHPAAYSSRAPPLNA